MLSMFHMLLKPLIHGPIPATYCCLFPSDIYLATARDSQQTGTSLAQAACACVVSILDGVLGPDTELTWPHCRWLVSPAPSLHHEVAHHCCLAPPGPDHSDPGRGRGLS